ncbi:MAG: hypothetical protein AAF993_14145 [Pseudomonadota bacterium]
MDWQQNPDWQQPFRSTAKKQMWFVWGFAGFWNLVSLPLLFVLPGEISGGNYPAALGLLFPVVGIFMVRWAVGITRQFRHYGVTELTLDPYPGSIGGQVGGTVTLPGSEHSKANYTATLMCIHSYMRGSGKERKRREKVLWQTAGPIVAGHQGTDTQLQFRFNVPDDLPHSEPSGSAYHYWKLVIEGDQARIPYNRAFEIPVFATAEVSQYITVDSDQLAATQAQQQVSAALASPQVAQRLRERTGLSLEVRADWIRLYFHRGRQKMMSFVLLLCGVCFTAVYWLPGDDFVTGLFRYVFGLVGLGMTLGGLYIPFNTLDVRINRNQVSRSRSWFGIRIKQQEIDPRQLRDIKITEGASTTSQNKHTVYYRLVGVGDFGEFRFAESIDDRALLEALAAKIREFAGLAPA